MPTSPEGPSSSGRLWLLMSSVNGRIAVASPDARSNCAIAAPMPVLPVLRSRRFFFGAAGGAGGRSGSTQPKILLSDSSFAISRSPQPQRPHLTPSTPLVCGRWPRRSEVVTALPVAVLMDMTAVGSQHPNLSEALAEVVMAKDVPSLLISILPCGSSRYPRSLS